MRLPLVSSMAGLALSAALLLASPASGATLTGDYKLEGNHSSSCGTAPNLVDVGPGSNAFATEFFNGGVNGVLTFPEGNGLALNTQGILPQERYTVIMQFRLAQVGGGATGYRSLLVFDSDPPDRDSGLYVHGGKLNFYDADASVTGQEEPTPSVAADQYIEVALTRDGADQVMVYANGAPRISYDDSAHGIGALLENAIEFFREFGDEESAGAVARIRVYDDALSAAEILAPPGCPQPAQPTAAATGQRDAAIKKCKKKHKGKAKAKKRKKCIKNAKKLPI